MDLMRLTQKQVCALFNKEDRTIRNWEKEDPPLPSHGTGKAKRYVWLECFEWWRNREFSALIQATRKGGEEVPPIAISEARDAAAKAEMRELDLAAKRGELVVLRDVEARVASRIGQCVVTLNGIPNRIRARVGPEAALAVAKEINNARELLAGGKTEGVA